jgi:hypothetical protein
MPADGTTRWCGSVPLLDDWTAAICYGRSGQGGQENRFASPKAEEARAVIRDRLSAPKRAAATAAT